MKHHHFKRSKMSKIMSLEAYQWLEDWTRNAQSAQRYKLDVKDYFYRKTSHRQYLSKLLESIIMAVLKGMGATVIKSSDRGNYIDNSKVVEDIAGRRRKIGSGNWVKSANVLTGRADLVSFFGGALNNLEIKIGNDRQSPAQKREQIRAEANGEKYFLIKTLEDFIELL